MIDNKLNRLNSAFTIRDHVGCNEIPCHSFTCGVERIRIGKYNESRVRHIQLRVSGTQVFGVCALI